MHGRAKCQLWPEILAIGFDGLICGAGAYVEVAGRVVVERSFDADVLAHIREYLDNQGTRYYMEAANDVFATPETVEALKAEVAENAGEQLLAVLTQGPFSFMNRVRHPDDGLAPIIKVMFFGSPVPTEQVRDEFAGVATFVPSSTDLIGANSGELMIDGVNKAVGMQQAIARMGVDIADTIAIGDSFNDVEMLAAAGIGVAMGDAPPSVVDAADLTTAPPGADGVWLALDRLGLLGD